VCACKETRMCVDWRACLAPVWKYGFSALLLCPMRFERLNVNGFYHLFLVQPLVVFCGYVFFLAVVVVFVNKLYQLNGTVAR